MKGRVFKRGETWSFTVDLPRGPDGKRRQRWKGGFALRREAEAALAALLTDEARGVAVDPSRQTVGAFLADWLASAAPALRPSTVAQYRYAVSLLVPELGGVKLQALRKPAVQAAYGRIHASGRSAGTVSAVHRAFRHALNHAVEWGMLATNPAAGKIVLPREDKPPMNTWSRAEARAFLDATRGDRLHTLWSLLLSTGMRRGEALGLRWEDVTLTAPARCAVVQTVVSVNGRVMLSEPKTQRGRRVVHIRPELVDLLTEHGLRQQSIREEHADLWHEHGLVFCTDVGTPFDPRNVNRAFDQACKRHGVQRIRVHDLRHTFATLALAAGTHPKLVQEMLGHSSVALTLDLYSHATVAMHADAADRVGEVLFGT